jgi:hypothetical protein
MLHYGSLNCNRGKAHILTGGYKGHVMIMGPGSSFSRTNGTRPFFQVWITSKEVRSLSPIFGRGIETFDSGDFNVHISNWRSLASFKLYHCLNARTAVLGVAVDALSRRMDDLPVWKTDQEYLAPSDYYTPHHKEIVKTFLSVPSLFSLSTSYETCRLLGDSRYMMMNSTGWLSNYRSFTLDKYAPPYKSCVDVFIVRKILKNCCNLSEEIKLTRQKVPTFMDNERMQTSIGGTIKLTGTYTGYTMSDMQDFLFEMFMVVLTPKESTSLHHKYIDAVNTMKKFQKAYETNTLYNKGFSIGMSNKEHMLNLLRDRPSVGFNHDFLYHVVKSHASHLNKRAVKIAQGKFDYNESIGSLSTTKGSVDSRTIDTVGEKLANKGLGIMQDGMAKARVHINMMRQIKERGGSKSHVHSWEEFFEESFKPHISIAIKAQYGSKREFYIQCETTRAVTNYVENHIFKPICTVDPQESITVKGDNKLVDLEKAQNEAYQMISQYNKRGVNYGIAQINGDCSKWSARALMGEFISTTQALRDTGLIDESDADMCNALFRKWTLKQIQVPRSIIESLTQDSREKYKYGEEGRIDRLELNSNFLQGFFNYSSSLKHSACAKVVLLVFNRSYPDRKGNIIHIPRVHSDDYSIVVLHKTAKDLILYRCIEKMVMTLTGILDSDKKTNVHLYFQEFVSLFLFNTSLYYPTIKISKDVGLSLPCTGFKDDLYSAISHSVNYLRRGGNMSTSYFLQKLANTVILEHYSLKRTCEFKEDNVLKTVDRRMLPIEVGGLSDTHPIMYLLGSTSANNYRILKHHPKYSKRLLWSLIAENCPDTDDVVNMVSLADDESLYSGFYSPSFTYIFQQDIEEFRKEFPMEPQDVISFWKEHPCYLFMKPNDHEYMFKSLNARLFSKQFSIAFSRQSRTALSIRLSHFARRRCVKIAGNLYTNEEATRFLLERSLLYHDPVKDDYSYLERTVCNCNSLIPMLDHMSLTSKVISREKTKTFLRVSRISRRYKTLNLTCNLSDLLQYRFSIDDFERDNRKAPSMLSLTTSLSELKKYFDLDRIEKTKQVSVPLLYKMLSLTQKRPLIMLTPCKRNTGIREITKSIIQRMSFFDTKLEISFNDTGNIVDPLDFTKNYGTFTGDMIFNQDEIVQNMMQIFLYMHVTLRRDKYEILEAFGKVKTRVPEGGVETYAEYLRRLSLSDLWSQPTKETIFNISIVKWIVLGDNTLALECLQRIAPYSFYYTALHGRWTSDNTPTGNDVVGQVNVRYGGIICQGTVTKPSTGDVRFAAKISRDTNPYVMKIAYLLSRMLLGQISDRYAYDFEELAAMNMKPEWMEDYNPKVHSLRFNKEGCIQTNFKGVEDKGLTNMTVGNIDDYTESRMLAEEAHVLPSIDVETLKVYTGMSRRYGWSGYICKTSSEYMQECNLVLNNLNMQSVLGAGVIERFLTGRNLEGNTKTIQMLFNTTNWDEEELNSWYWRHSRNVMFDTSWGDQVATNVLGSSELNNLTFENQADVLGKDLGISVQVGDDSSDSYFDMEYDEDDDGLDMLEEDLDNYTLLEKDNSSYYKDVNDGIFVNVIDDYQSLDYEAERRVRRKARGIKKMEQLERLNSRVLMDLLLVRRKVPKPNLAELQAFRFLCSEEVVRSVYESSKGMDRFKVISIFNGLRKVTDFSVPLQPYYNLILRDRPSLRGMALNIIKVHSEGLPLTETGKRVLADIIQGR